MASSNDFSRATNRRMGYAMLVLGVLVLVPTLWFGALRIGFYQQAAHAPGRVSEVARSRMTAVEFTTAAGAVVRIRPFGNRDSNVRVGDRVEVVYLEAEPKKAYLNEFMPLWGGQLLGAIAAAILLLLGRATLQARVMWGPR